MLPTFVGLFLIALLLFAHYSVTNKKKSLKLDIDEDLPFPAAGQGSSIFSLTALFGAYLAILFVVGILAVLGLVVGTILGLSLIRYRSIKYKENSFQKFLFEHFNTKDKSNVIFISLIAITQILFATSELLLLKGVLSIGFQISSNYAAVISVLLGMIVYFYSLTGGYLTVFRTDIVQFIAIISMCLVIIFHVIVSPPMVFSFKSLNILSLSWSLGITNSFIVYIFQIFWGFIMGFSFIIASPDTWKRVFISVKSRHKNQFLMLVLAGVLPFVVLLPLKFYYDPGNILSVASLKFLISTIINENQLYLSIVLVGVISSFMSSFDSSLITSVHLFAINETKSSTLSQVEDKKIFIKYMGINFLLINLMFIVIPGLSIKNLYFLPNLLIGAYAIIGGYLTGTRGLLSKLPLKSLLVVIIIGLVSWFIYLVSIPNIIEYPQVNQIETVPYGILLFIIIVSYSFFFSKKDESIKNS
ncbi:MAG: hypothetical protein IPM32_09100 [Ignavibacteriae bacterium]|nr:hypothetical protein [Ignavibacteriota bacterium]